MYEPTPGTKDRRHVSAHHVGRTRTFRARSLFQGPGLWALMVILSGRVPAGGGIAP
jgi:hypothetical protein